MSFNKNNLSGQGTIEYLVIIAIVIVISLAVVSILSGFIGTSGDASLNNQHLSNQIQNVALMDVLKNPNGNILWN